MQQLKRSTSVSKSVLVILLILGGGSCMVDTHNPDTHGITLGEIQLALGIATNNGETLEFHGRIVNYDTRDSLYPAPGLGLFKHFIEMVDTVSQQHVTVYYTLPVTPAVRVDTTLRIALFYKRVQTRSALLIKDKSDSLICMIGTLLPHELEPLQAMTGAQNIHIVAGQVPTETRITDCGREGDFNTIFANNEFSISLNPAQTTLLQNSNRTYLLANVANTYLIKNLKGCDETVAKFAYFMIRQ